MRDILRRQPLHQVLLKGQELQHIILSYSRKSILDKIFFRHNNLDYYSQNIKDLTLKTPAYKIFDVINSFSSDSEIRYVGGCIRKILNKEKVDDIDLSTNLEPAQVCEVLKKANISFYETGKRH